MKVYRVNTAKIAMSHSMSASDVNTAESTIFLVDGFASMRPIVDIVECAAVEKERLTMEDIVGGYFSDPPPRHKRIPCPLHGGKDYNFSFNNKFYKCFVCGESGDILSLVSKYFHLSFVDTVRKINNDFGLGLDIDSPSVESVTAVREAAARQAALREERGRELDEAQRAYDQALDVFTAFDKIMLTYPPNSDEYANAERQMAIARYNLDEEETRLARVRAKYG